MKTIALGKSGIECSAIVMGLWQAGKQYWTGIDDNEIGRAIDIALDSGINTFDTAEEYGGGHSERTLGAALKGKRNRAILLTKVFSNHLKYDQVKASCEQSLKNLQTDVIDLYQIHWPSGSWESEVVPIQETMGALNKLKSEGKIRSIGVSNFSLPQIEEAERFGRIDSLQSPYSLLWRYLDNKIIPYCQSRNIAVLAYSPLAQGVLSGKVTLGHRFEEGDNRANNKLVQPEMLPGTVRVVSALRPIAEKKGVTLSQLALAWIVRQEGLAAIAGVRNAKQARDNAGAGNVKLTASEAAEIEHIAHPIADRFKADPIPWTWNP